MLLIDKQAHQFGNGDRRMGVVKLDGNPLRKTFQFGIAVRRAVTAQYVAQRAGDQKILLNQPQLLTAQQRVRRIENFRDRFRGDLLLDSVEIIAFVEDLHIEILRRTCGVEPQIINALTAVTRHRKIGRDPDQHLPVKPHGVVLAVTVNGMFDPPVDWNYARFFGALDQPWRPL